MVAACQDQHQRLVNAQQMHSVNTYNPAYNYDHNVRTHQYNHDMTPSISHYAYYGQVDPHNNYVDIPVHRAGIDYDVLGGHTSSYGLQKRPSTSQRRSNSSINSSTRRSSTSMNIDMSIRAAPTPRPTTIHQHAPALQHNNYAMMNRSHYSMMNLPDQTAYAASQSYASQNLQQHGFDVTPQAFQQAMDSRRASIATLHHTVHPETYAQARTNPHASIASMQQYAQATASKNLAFRVDNYVESTTPVPSSSSAAPGHSQLVLPTAKQSAPDGDGSFMTNSRSSVNSSVADMEKTVTEAIRRTSLSSES